jgi:hypothetical protein
LVKDPTKRLGAGRGDADDIKIHPFFRSVNWDDTLHKRIPPPFFPQIVRLLWLKGLIIAVDAQQGRFKFR